MSDENLTEFAPSEHQQAVLNAFQDEDYGCTVEAACQAANVTRQAYYLWFGDPGFCRWWMEQAEHFFGLRLPRVQSALYKAATEVRAPADAKYNPRAIEIFLQRFDHRFAPASRQIKEVQVDVSTLDNRTAELLAAYLADDSEGPEGETPTANATHQQLCGQAVAETSERLSKGESADD